MEQRIYHGTITPDGLAQHLVDEFDPKPNVQAQKLGRGETFLVQLGGGDTPDQVRRAVTLAIAQADDGLPGVKVTLGEQQWINNEQAGHVAFWTLLGAIFTPWALFMLIFPLKDLVEDLSEVGPERIWNSVELYCASQGATLNMSTTLAHPHA